MMAKVGNHGLWAVCCVALFICAPVACNEESKGTQSNVGDAAEPGDGAGSDAGDAAEPDPALKTASINDGKLQGDVVGKAVRFLKIPYAKPPVGELRWKAPEPNEPWTGVRHETKFASPCPQAKSQQGPASEDEDCLYLNVWRPYKVTKKAPVMVWIHGGGFTTGSAADLIPLKTDPDYEKYLWYNGRYFAGNHGVVVVTINYRLGVFGFFAHPALADEGSPVGNQGLLDQQLALKWVKANIKAFGGDPGNVTIFGESAGAGSVCMHLVSPGSRGLFHRAIGESGGCTTGGATDRDALNEQLAQFASDRGCEGDDALACLRAKPVNELMSTEAIDRTAGLEALRSNFIFGAVVDGEGGFLPEPARDLFDRGEVAKVPYLIGTNTDEARLYYLSAPVPASEVEFEAEIRDKYGDFADRVLELYPLSKFDGDIRSTMARIATDSGLVCGSHDTARRAVKAGLSVYMYNFNIPWSILPDLLGVSHASEISHVFGKPYVPEKQDEKTTNDSQMVADAMNAYWAEFAATGDPNYDGAPALWPAFKPDANDNDQRLQLDPDFNILDSFRKEECQLWREYGQSAL